MAQVRVEIFAPEKIKVMNINAKKLCMLPLEMVIRRAQKFTATPRYLHEKVIDS
jgi:hypothetical protein